MFVSRFELKNNMAMIFIHLLLHKKGLIHLPIFEHLIFRCNSRSLLSFSSARWARGFDDSIHRRKCLLSGHLFLLPLKLATTDERFRWQNLRRRFLGIGCVETHYWMCIGFIIFWTIWSFFCGIMNSYPKRYKLKNAKARAPVVLALLAGGFGWNSVWESSKTYP